MEGRAFGLKTKIKPHEAALLSQDCVSLSSPQVRPEYLKWVAIAMVPSAKKGKKEFMATPKRPWVLNRQPVF